MLSFKQQVVVALLQNLSWMPKFDNAEQAAKYLNVDTPTTTFEAIKLNNKLLATFVCEVAEMIVERTPDV